MISPIILIILVFILLIALAAVFVSKRKYNHKVNYRLLFILGVCWIPIALSTKNPIFMACSFIFMIIGITNRKKWNNQPRWSELPPGIRKMRIILMIVLVLVLLLGIAVFLLAEKKVINF
ncbi:MAG: hypothetical protein H8E57_00505 [Candidatus Cloacimonetes bacterium]|nr:hypothetical protein [Candidatus Cloacimonadota bacterium]